YIVAIRVHDLRPCRHEVVYELVLRSGAGIDFREGTQLRVRTENQVDTCSGPLGGVRLTIASFVDAVFPVGRMPLRAHIQQVDEEVIGQNARRLSEDTVLGTAGVRAKQ